MFCAKWLRCGTILASSGRLNIALNNRAKPRLAKQLVNHSLLEPAYQPWSPTMSKLAFLPLIIISTTAMLTWAISRYAEIANKQRTTAARNPRSRPYATSLPKSLIQR